MLTDEQTRCLQSWKHSITQLAVDKDLDFVRCLRLISGHILPGLVEPVKLDVHVKQCSASEADDLCCMYWAKGIEVVLDTNDELMAPLFQLVSERVLERMSLPPMILCEQWVNPLKVKATICVVLSRTLSGRELLSQCVFRGKFSVVTASDRETINRMERDSKFDGPYEGFETVGNTEEAMKAEVCVQMSETAEGRRILSTHIFTEEIQLFRGWNKSDSKDELSDWPGLEHSGPLKNLPDLEDCDDDLGMPSQLNHDSVTNNLMRMFSGPFPQDLSSEKADAEDDPIQVD